MADLLDDGVDAKRLPKVYVTSDGSQIADPVYRLLAQGYYDDVLWPEGEILATHMIPNHQMQPLNRAAGEKFTDFIASLPDADGVTLRVEDLVEAATMLRPKEGEPMVSSEDWGRAVRKLAIRVQEDRIARQRPQIPSNASISRTQRSSAPAMPNAVYEDRRANYGHPGDKTTPRPVTPGQSRSVAPAPPASAMGNQPPRA